MKNWRWNWLCSFAVAYVWTHHIEMCLEYWWRLCIVRMCAFYSDSIHSYGLHCGCTTNFFCWTDKSFDPTLARLDSRQSTVCTAAAVLKGDIFDWFNRRPCLCAIFTPMVIVLAGQSPKITCWKVLSNGTKESQFFSWGMPRIFIITSQ